MKPNRHAKKSSLLEKKKEKISKAFDSINIYYLGWDDGWEDGWLLGCIEGCCEGWLDGCSEGCPVGW